jgi:hypothetical protein
MPIEAIDAEMMGTALMTKERLVIDMSDEISLLQPDDTPLTVLLNKITEKKDAVATKFEWQEDDILPWSDAINCVGGYLAADDQLVVDNASIFNLLDIVHVPRTGENMRVTGKNNANNTIDVTRGWGSTAAALLDNDPLIILAGASPEGDLARKPIITNPTPFYNFTQIIRTSVGVTGTAEAIKTHGPAELARQHINKGIEHKVSLERAFLFGTRHETTDAVTGHAIRTTGGLLSWLKDNRWATGGSPTEADFNEWLESVFQYGSKIKWAMASPRWATTFDGWGREKLRINDKASAATGLSVSEYRSSHGRLMIVEHPLLTGAVYGGQLVVLDPRFIKKRPLKGRDTHIRTNIQENARDGREDEILTEAGIEVRMSKAHAVATGLSIA